MADFAAWLTTSDSALRPATNEAERAALAWQRINDKPSSVTFRTNAGTDLTAQTVRVESDNTASDTIAAAGKAARRGLIVFGVRNHDTVTDTDMAAGYRFVFNSGEYRISSVITTLGEVQGIAEAVS